MKKLVDARGLSCPQPVLEAKKAIETLGDARETDSVRIEILVDTATSRENVSRFAKKNGFDVETSEIADGFSVVLT